MLRNVSFWQDFFSIVPDARTAGQGPRTLSDQWDWSQIRLRCRVEAVRILRRHHDAEEVVQEALARAWRGRRSCRNPDEPLAWCLQITRNEAFRLIRRQRQRAPVEPLDAGSDVADEQALHEPDRTVIRLDVARALKRLSASERVLILLRYEQGLSHPQIAARLDIPEATARVRLHRAQKRLRFLLDESA
ncbi:MAG TPA: RNA polymerase sigma factor [Solirubrobacteraceae bacterium]|nr:RNA polymerase sigma factor [Solirubrobacteraceae bacterium]